MTRLVARARADARQGGESLVAFFAGEATSENPRKRERAQVGARLVWEGLSNLRRLAGGNG